MSAQTIVPIDPDRIRQQGADNREPSWMTALRLEALELASSLELPKLDKTRIDRWQLDAYGQYKRAAAIGSASEVQNWTQSLLATDEQPESPAVAANNVIIQRDSGVVFTHLAPELAQQGVIFTDLETAVREHSDLVERYFMTAVRKDENRLTALHAALWNGGVFVYVPKNVQIEAPLQAMFVTEDPAATFAPHVMIIAEANSRITYVDSYVSGGSNQPAVHNGAAEVFVKAGAQVRFASVHHLNETTTDLSYRRAVVDNDGRIEWVVGELNYGNGMSDTVSVLKGNGSFSDTKVICVGTSEQKLNITTRAVHHGRNSASEMTTRAVMRDHSTAIVNGITKIEKGATGANGQQTEKVLMLSPRARGDANPILLIDEDEVKAGHAASVGQLNADQVYYLMSRGLSKEEAQRLLIYGFLAPVVSEIPNEKLEERFRKLVERKLGL